MFALRPSIANRAFLSILGLSSRSPNGQSRATDWWGIGINLDHRSHRFSDPARLAPAPCNFRRYVGTALIQIDRFSPTAFVKQTVSKPPESDAGVRLRSEEHTSELQSLIRISYAVF